MEVLSVSDAQNQDNKENVVPVSPLLFPTPPLPKKKRSLRWRRIRLPLRDVTHLFNSIEAQSSSSSLSPHQSVDFVASDLNSRKRKAATEDDSFKHRQISKSLRMGFR